jgi:hypothetical protein
MSSLLLIESAYFDPLFIAEERNIDSSRQMVFSEFKRGTGVNNAVTVEKARVEGYSFRHNKLSLSAEV